MSTKGTANGATVTYGGVGREGMFSHALIRRVTDVTKTSLILTHTARRTHHSRTSIVSMGTQDDRLQVAVPVTDRPSES
jgi:hypothetical protein